MKGEINHELIIERDLANLGEDVKYVARFHQPTPATMAFMCIQESIVGFQRDPVLFLACPIAAEGFAAYVHQDVFDGVGRSIGNWGLENPADVTHFIRSHSGFDGGPDGHWYQCIKILKDHVRSDTQMQRFSAVVHAAMSALEENYDSCVQDYEER